MKDNVVYVKTENGIFKCYESETMHKPIYYPINSNGYIDYTDVIKILTTDDLFIENQKLKKQLEEYIRAEFKAKDELEKQRQEYQDVYKDVRIEIKSYKNQQKEFIEYLEDKLCVINNLLNTEQDEAKVYYLIVRRTAFDEILSKYKEIIGSDNK